MAPDSLLQDPHRFLDERVIARGCYFDIFLAVHNVIAHLTHAASEKLRYVSYEVNRILEVQWRLAEERATFPPQRAENWNAFCDCR
jgi:hypothetical protein